MQKLPKFAKGERGSALVEAAIMIPVLIMLLYWAIGMTDIMVLRVKAAEAARFSLWETTVFRTQNEISPDVALRFRDLRSPASVNLEYTGLLLYPQSSNMIFASQVRTNRSVNIGGKVKLDNPTGPIDFVLNVILGAVTGSVDGATRFFKFNTNGGADARVTLVRASHIGSQIFGGGEILKGVSMDHSAAMQNFSFTSPVSGANPMRLVFDTWKAWPKPRQFTTDGGKTNTNVNPMATYLTVEQQVSSQVDKIAFYGAKQLSVLTAIDNFFTKVRSNPVAGFLFGGTVPSIISTDRMDSAARGPITIRPVGDHDFPWVPAHGQFKSDERGSHRLGELAGFKNPVYAEYPRTAILESQDMSRYTVPYKINSQYYSDHGGNDRNLANVKHTLMKPALSQNNDYVRTYACRGHFFSGGINPGITDFKKRYKSGCYQP